MEIQLKKISKRFAGKTVIFPLDLTITDGSFTTLLGPSGCGKTTLLRMIAGLETPDEGEIFLDDVCVFSKAKGIYVPPEKRGLAFVFQDFALWPHMSVFENVAFGLRARQETVHLAERVREALATVHLEDMEKRYPHQLSGGQQQRVAFARAIAIHPGCILFDEPLSALDALLREEMRHELKELTASLQITSIFVTHDQTEAMSMSDQIAVMHDGHVEQVAPPEEIYHRPATRFTAHFVGKSNWITPDALFRPESAVETECPGAQRYDLKVETAQYLGDAYELMAPYGEALWTIRSRRKKASGDALTIYVHPEQVIAFSNERGETR